jgi:hypothetical protein
MSHKFAIVCSGPIYAHPRDWIDRTFVQKYDPDYNRGEGRAWFTNDMRKALLFDTIEQAMAYVHRVPVNHPLTESGCPNYPIGCFKVEFQTVQVERWADASKYNRRHNGRPRTMTP